MAQTQIEHQIGSALRFYEIGYGVLASESAGVEALEDDKGWRWHVGNTVCDYLVDVTDILPNFGAKKGEKAIEQPRLLRVAERHEHLATVTHYLFGDSGLYRLAAAEVRTELAAGLDYIRHINDIGRASLAASLAKPSEHDEMLFWDLLARPLSWQE